MKYCKCRKIYIDGGDCYLRYGWPDGQAEDYIEFVDNPAEIYPCEKEEKIIDIQTNNLPKQQGQCNGYVRTILSLQEENKRLLAQIDELKVDKRRAVRAFHSIMLTADIRNGGTACDNPVGPCACGAYHNWQDMADRIVKKLA